MVDDDNVLQSDYLVKAARIADHWPQLGTWGGQCIAEFEAAPPEWTKAYWSWIAIRELSQDTWSNSVLDGAAMPVGAGMCVRRRVALHFRDQILRNPSRLALGRIGQQLTGCEDTDLCFASCKLGLGNGTFRSLQLTHIIPQAQLCSNVPPAFSRRSHMLFGTSEALRRKPRCYLPCRSQKLFTTYQQLRMPRRNRMFEKAKARGIGRALSIINSGL